MDEASIDITQEACPMTFVHVKLKLEGMTSGSRLHIRLDGGEPLENIPRSLQEEGYQILSLEPDGEAFLLTVQVA